MMMMIMMNLIFHFSYEISNYQPLFSTNRYAIGEKINCWRYLRIFRDFILSKRFFSTLKKWLGSRLVEYLGLRCCWFTTGFGLVCYILHTKPAPAAIIIILTSTFFSNWSRVCTAASKQHKVDNQPFPFSSCLSLEILKQGFGDRMFFVTSTSSD